MKPNFVFSGARRRSFMRRVPVWAPALSYRQLARTGAAVPERDHHPGHRHRGEDRGYDAEAERDSEAAHRAGAEEIEDERRDEHRHVRVDNGGEGASETGIERREHRPPKMRLLADAL